MSTQDKLQDVFPIEFEFVKGEQPSGTKFSGWVKQTDTAFSRMGAALGDPWAYQSHIHPLSPQKLGQTSLARFAGPSDWVSPTGSCWNETIGSDIYISLGNNRNTWSIGFPLVKTVSDINELPRITTNVTPLVWNTDLIAETDIDGLLVTPVASPSDITTHGEFHINYYTGVVTAYQSSSSTITLRIYSGQFNMFGPGVPWGTSNVIPTWDQSSVCTVAEDLGSPSLGLSTYTVTLPTVTTATRSPGFAASVTGAAELYGEGTHSGVSDVWFGVAVAGEAANYRLPHALTSGFSPGEEIPEGYMYLWDENLGRIIPLTTFYYKGENDITVVTPENQLTIGMSVRILVPGTSLGEAVNYLMSATRDNRHTGLADGQDNKTMAYTSPLSHAHLADRYGGVLLESQPDREKFQFRESDYPTNPHPQYIHRAGYMASDVDGNSGNAMRGDLVLAQTDTAFTLGNTYEESYGILFGGGGRTSGSGNARFAFEGASGMTDWVDGGSTGPAKRFPFGIYATGAMPVAGVYYGALTHTPWRGMPLYLRGKYSFAEVDNYAGAILGFDLGRLAELNYIKLLQGIRDGSGDQPNRPVETPSNTGVFSSELDCTQSSVTGLINRLAPDQMREFRFRGVPYCVDATNTSDSIGAGSIAEFNQYFTSPGIVGADFFNVYSNAIFFSVNPDGQRTSFTEHAEAWLNSGSTRPVGIYYVPNTGDPNGEFSFWTQGDDSNRHETFKFSRNNPTLLSCASDITLSTLEDLYLIGITSAELSSLGTTTVIGSTAIALTTGSSSVSGFLRVYVGHDTTGPSDGGGGIDISLGHANLTTTLNDKNIYIRNMVNPFPLNANDMGVFCDSTMYVCGDSVEVAAGTYPSSSNNSGRISLNPSVVLLECREEPSNDTSTITITPAAIALASEADIWLTIGTGEDLRFVGLDEVGSGVDLMIDDVRVYKDTSSIEFKENIEEISNYDWVYALEPKQFTFKKDKKGITHYGFVAEDVAKINKDLVVYDEEEKPYALRRKSFMAGVIKVLQDQKKEIDGLKTELAKKANKRTTKKK